MRTSIRMLTSQIRHMLIRYSPRARADPLDRVHTLRSMRRRRRLCRPSAFLAIAPLFRPEPNFHPVVYVETDMSIKNDSELLAKLDRIVAEASHRKSDTIAT